MIRLTHASVLSLTVAVALTSTGHAQSKLILNTGGNLTYTSPREAGKHFVVHTVFLAAGRQYNIEMNSLHFDTFVRVKNAAGAVVAQNDDGGAGLNSRVTFRPLVSGTFRIIATSFRANATGAYRLRVNQLGGIGPVPFPGKTVLNANGELRYTDPKQAGKHFKTHQVFLRAGRQYTITMNSNHFDTFIKLTNGAVVLAQNDDGGPALNSRVVFRPTVSRHYTIVATSFRQGATGSYRLTVRE